MKKICLSLLTAVLCFQVLSQVNYSGFYGYSFKPPANTPKEYGKEGQTGMLVLLKMQNNLYRFWLNINRGWPSYGEGATDGTITIVKDTASFDNTYENAKDSCILHFKFTPGLVTITCGASDFDCDFAHGVYADGDYARLKTQPVIDNKWLKEQYPDAPAVMIKAKKAEVFQDENCRRSSNEFFSQGDSVLNITETEHTFYTEFITPKGKFIYGWIKKIAAEFIEPE